MQVARVCSVVATYFFDFSHGATKNYRRIHSGYLIFSIVYQPYGTLSISMYLSIVHFVCDLIVMRVCVEEIYVLHIKIHMF